MLKDILNSEPIKQPRIRILLVDDHSFFLDLAADELSSDKRIEIVGFAESGDEALELVAETKPDLVLIDIAMPVINGLEVTRQIKAQSNPPFLVIVTLHDTPYYHTAATEAGADGFVVKEDFDTQIWQWIIKTFGWTERAYAST